MSFVLHFFERLDDCRRLVFFYLTRFRKSCKIYVAFEVANGLFFRLGLWRDSIFLFDSFSILCYYVFNLSVLYESGVN